MQTNKFVQLLTLMVTLSGAFNGVNAAATGSSQAESKMATIEKPLAERLKDAENALNDAKQKVGAAEAAFKNAIATANAAKKAAEQAKTDAEKAEVASKEDSKEEAEAKSQAAATAGKALTAAESAEKQAETDAEIAKTALENAKALQATALLDFLKAKAEKLGIDVDAFVSALASTGSTNNKAAGLLLLDESLDLWKDYFYLCSLVNKAVKSKTASSSSSSSPTASSSPAAVTSLTFELLSADDKGGISSSLGSSQKKLAAKLAAPEILDHLNSTQKPFLTEKLVILQQYHGITVPTVKAYRDTLSSKAVSPSKFITSCADIDTNETTFKDGFKKFNDLLPASFSKEALLGIGGATALIVGLGIWKGKSLFRYLKYDVCRMFEKSDTKKMEAIDALVQLGLEKRNGLSDKDYASLKKEILWKFSPEDRELIERIANDRIAVGELSPTD